MEKNIIAHDIFDRWSFGVLLWEIESEGERFNLYLIVSASLLLPQVLFKCPIL